MRIATFMISCAEREAVRTATLARLAQTDWREPVVVQMDKGRHGDKIQRITDTFLGALERAADAGAPFVLLLEDDLAFSRQLHGNLLAWAPLRARTPDAAFFASLYDPGRPALWRSPGEHYYVAVPEAVWGSQAVLVSRATVRFLLQHWHEGSYAPDLRMPRLAARIGPVYYHTPSLVQHVGVTSTWGGGFHQASSFDPAWRASALAAERDGHSP